MKIRTFISVEFEQIEECTAKEYEMAKHVNIDDAKRATEISLKHEIEADKIKVKDIRWEVEI